VVVKLYEVEDFVVEFGSATLNVWGVPRLHKSGPLQGRSGCALIRGKSVHVRLLAGIYIRTLHGIEL